MSYKCYLSFFENLYSDLQYMYIVLEYSLHFSFISQCLAKPDCLVVETIPMALNNWTGILYIAINTYITRVFFRMNTKEHYKAIKLLDTYFRNYSMNTRFRCSSLQYPLHDVGKRWTLANLSIVFHSNLLVLIVRENLNMRFCCSNSSFCLSSQQFMLQIFIIIL